MPFDLLEEEVSLMASLQIVIGNPRAQMMNVMKSDVAREPLQDLGQFVERTALQRCRGVIPLAAAFPVNSFKLMLDIKQPHAGRTGHQHRRQLNYQVSLEPKNGAQPGGGGENCQICPIDRVTLSLGSFWRGEPMFDHKQEKRRNEEEHDRVAREPVQEPIPARGLQVFLDRQRPHVASAAPIQVARG